MNASYLHVEDIFRDEDLIYYNKSMDFFQLEITRLNANIFILDHVLEFPFSIFPDPGALFFRFVFENFFYMSLMFITRLFIDVGDDLLTLPRFKNEIRKRIKPEYIKDFNEKMRAVRFNKETKETQKLCMKARNLRNERIAHVKQEIVIGITEETRVKFGEIKILRDRLSALFKALSFDEIRFTNYYPPLAAFEKTDIELILDWIAQNSPLLHSPEKDPNGWKYSRESYTELEIQRLNEYRRKFNLPEI